MLEVKIKQLLFKILSLKNYLLIISKVFFVLFKTGFLKNNPLYKNLYYLKNFIKEGDYCIDIGANLGYFTVPLSDWTGQNGKVFAVEPVNEVFGVLQKNTIGRSNIELLPFALGDENKKIKLGNNTLVEGGTGSGSHVVLSENQVATLEFDSEMRKGSELFSNLPKLDFIKCDIEGFEVVVLPEMKNIIVQHLPLILVEARRENRAIIIKFFNDLEYQGFVLDHDKLSPVESIPEKMEDDIFFFHKDKVPQQKINF